MAHHRRHRRLARRLIVKGYGLGLVGNIVVGIIGAIIAGWLLPMIGFVLVGGTLAAIVNAVIGAVILLIIIGFFNSTGRTGARMRTGRDPPCPAPWSPECYAPRNCPAPTAAGSRAGRSVFRLVAVIQCMQEGDDVPDVAFVERRRIAGAQAEWKVGGVDVRPEGPGKSS